MKIRSLLFFSLSFVFVLASCTSGKKSVRHAGLSEDERKEFSRNFFDATRNKMVGNSDQALNYYLQCIRIDGTADAAMFEAALILKDKNKFDNALIFMKRASQVNPDNIWYQLNLADLFQKNKLFPEAVEVLQGLVKTYPDRVDFYFDLAEALIYSGKYVDAIKVYDKLESMTGLSPDVSVQKEKLYVRLGKFDKSVAEIQKLIDAYPKEPKYYGLLAELYQANGMNERAMEVLQKAQLMDPENPYLHLSLAEYYRSKGDKEKSFSELKIGFSSTRLDLDTKIQILSSYYDLIVKFPELKDQARELNTILIQTNPNEARAFAIYAAFLYEEKKYEEARAQYRKALDLDKQSFAMWQALLYLDSDLKDFPAMQKESEDALTLFPSQPILYFFNGLSKIELKKEKEGIETLKSGLNLVVENNPLIIQFQASLGDAYNRLHEYKESDEAFDAALALDPKNSYVLNNYSYYLSLRGDSIDKAARMSLLSNQLEPNNSSFQDTYGWILYKSANYSEAKQWIEKALAGAGDGHAVILEHYGDILWKLQMYDKALEYWQKASKAGQGSDFLDKKISEKKLIE